MTIELLSESYGQDYQTFYVGKLQIFVLNYSVFCKPFRDSIVFASKACAYLSETHLKCSTLG